MRSEEIKSKVSAFFTRSWLKRVLALVLASAALYWFVGMARDKVHSDSIAGVDVTGVHHLGPNFNVSQFFVDGYYGSNVGRGGGGGSNVCCVLLPKKWRPGLSAEVRWSLNDWSHEKPSEVEAGNYDSVAGGGSYIATVPVERYEKASHVWVHFYTGGKVRIVSSQFVSWGKNHPIQDNDQHAVDSATAGRRVGALFSDAERVEMQRKDEEHKKAHGDWR